MAGQQKQSATRRLKAAGQRLWDSVLAEFQLEPYELSLLTQAAQTLDIIDDLQAVIETLGVDTAGRELAEVRQQRLVYARIIVALRLPNGLEGDDRRPQRRGLRGVYNRGA
jgi:hypothetical protein